jgi:hypothetical protein
MASIQYRQPLARARLRKFPLLLSLRDKDKKSHNVATFEIVCTCRQFSKSVFPAPAALIRVSSRYNILAQVITHKSIFEENEETRGIVL